MSMRVLTGFFISFFFLLSNEGHAAPNESSQPFPTGDWVYKQGNKTIGTVMSAAQTSPLMLGPWSFSCAGAKYRAIVVKAGGQDIYVSCFDTSQRLPVWTYHLLDGGKLQNTLRPIVEPWFHWSGSANGTRLTSPASTYDRGHLTPRSDFAKSPIEAASTFTVLNRAPQHWFFNQQSWRCAESLVRGHVATANPVGRLHIFTGISGSQSKSSTEAKNSSGAGKNLSVPKYYWKVIIPYGATNFGALLFYDENSYTGKQVNLPLKLYEVWKKLPDDLKKSLTAMGIDQPLFNSTAAKAEADHFYLSFVKKSWFKGKTIDEALVRKACKQTEIVCSGTGIYSLKATLLRRSTRNKAADYEDAVHAVIVAAKDKACPERCIAKNWNFKMQPFFESYKNDIANGKPSRASLLMWDKRPSLKKQDAKKLAITRMEHDILKSFSDSNCAGQKGDVWGLCLRQAGKMPFDKSYKWMLGRWLGYELDRINANPKSGDPVVLSRPLATITVQCDY